MNQHDAEAAHRVVVDLLAALRAGDANGVLEGLTGQLTGDAYRSDSPVQLVCDALGLGFADVSRVVASPRVYPRHDGSAIVPVAAGEPQGAVARGVLVTKQGRSWKVVGLARLDSSADVFRVGTA